MPNPNEPLSLLKWALDLGKTHPFVDFHAHPFCVLSGNVDYQAAPQREGLFSSGSAHYESPRLEGKLQLLGSHPQPQVTASSKRALLLASRFVYSHTGPKVFRDQLDLVGLSKVLLFPVARVTGDAEKLLEAAGRMFPQDDRLLLGCPIPIGTPAERLEPFFRASHKTWNLHAIKLHPNLAGIDPLTANGREIVEATLHSAGSLNLPVVVHGGRTPGLEPAETREYGMLSRLASINWSISPNPVVIAHAGCYGMDIEEIPATISRLENLFEEHPNIMADTSALELPALCILLDRVDRTRLIFGSDALYFPIWRGWFNLLQALHTVSRQPDVDLIRIASLNPAQCLSALHI